MSDQAHLTTNPGLSPEHFNDDRIEEIRNGDQMTTAERTYLLETLPRFEECNHTAAEIAALNDADLMREAYWIWREYAGNQGLI